MNKLAEKFYATLPLFLQIMRFGIVGVIAAAIHFSTVVMLVQGWDMAPLVANIIGFMVAFQMSYWGHRLWTFNDTESLHRVAVSRLLVVQVLNFAANEILFYIFLSLNLPYQLALIIVLTVLPVFTFISSKMWVFR